jgi:glycosyltransferase involved in cell wall biosynthesis
LRSRAFRLIFDFDDAVFLRDSYSARGLDDPVRLRRFARTVRSADAVVAGNSFLRASALQWTAEPCVHVIPTCVDPEHYSLAEPVQGRGAIELAWIGSSSTLQGLERCSALLELIGTRISGLALKLICDQTLSLQHLPVRLCRWSKEDEATALASADIGFSWVPDDDWSRGKCGLKVLQYMAAGLPVVANPVGVHVEMIRHNATGFLAETPEQWVSAIGRLASDAVLRARMGRAGRLLVEERYSVSYGAQRWLDVIDSLERGAAQTA